MSTKTLTPATFVGWRFVWRENHKEKADTERAHKDAMHSIAAKVLADKSFTHAEAVAITRAANGTANAFDHKYANVGALVEVFDRDPLDSSYWSVVTADTRETVGSVSTQRLGELHRQGKLYKD